MSILTVSLKKIKSVNLNQLRSHLVRNMVGTFGLRVVNIGLSFVTSIALARLVGAADYGVYVYAMTWITLFSVVAALGLDKLLVRNIAAYQATASWSLMRGFLRWANWVVFAVAICMTAGSLIAVSQFFPDLDGVTRATLLVSFLMLPLWAFARLWQSAVRGFGWIVRGQLAEFLIRPLSFVVLIVGVYWGWHRALTGPLAMALQVTASAVGLLLALWFLRKVLPGSVATAVSEYQPMIWLASAMPLLLSNALEVANTRADILLLGSIQGAEAVAIYNVAKRLAELVTFVLTAVNMSIGPRIAALYAVGDMATLQKLITKSAAIILGGSLLLAVGLLLVGPWTLLLWGMDFAGGYTTLAILVVGQIVNAAMGPVALLLIMTRYERDVVWGTGIGLVINVGLNLLLIPRWSTVGTAVATLVATAIWNTLLVVFAFKRLGIYTLAYVPERLRK